MSVFDHHIWWGDVRVTRRFVTPRPSAPLAVPRVMLGVLTSVALAFCAVGPGDAVASSTGVEGAIRALSSPPETPDHGTADALAWLESEISAARIVWAKSEGQVLTTESRDQLGRTIAVGVRLGDDPRRMVAFADGRDSAAYLAELRAAAAEIGRDARRVEDDIVAWHAEQERQELSRAAELAAQRAAAAELARPASRSTAAGGVRTSAVEPAPWVEHIWTTGGQQEIDQCRGSVDVLAIADYLGGDFYAAEHWTCGGSAWSSIGTGELVSFPGHGVYRVSGRVSGLAYGSDASAIPAGYAAYYQTCIGGSDEAMAVWLLTRA